MKIGGGLAALGVFALLVVIGVSYWNFGLYERVQAGEACLVLRHGQIEKTVGPGKHFDAPWGTEFRCQETMLQTGSVGEHDGKTDYQRSPIVTESKDARQVTVTAQFRYATPMESLGTLYTQGARTPQQAWDKFVQKEADAAIREVVNSTGVRDLYLDGREAASTRMEENLRARLSRFDITLDSFQLTSVTPPKDYVEALALQQQQEEATQLEREKQQTITAQNDNLLLQEQGKAKALLVAEQAKADAEVIAAKGTAESNKVVAASITPEIIEMARIEALKSVNWAILPADTVMPTLPVEQPEEPESNG